MDTSTPHGRSSGSLLIRGIARSLTAFLILGGLFFGSAGSFRYYNGWIYIGTLGVLLGTGLTILYRKDPELFKRRMKTAEREISQKMFIVFSLIIVLTLFSLPGIDYRFGWSRVPMWLVCISEGVLITSYVLYLAVMRQNSYASRVVEIQEEQKLIDTGLYGVVRHPMYLAITILYLASPLVLGSFWAVIPAAIFPIALGFRIVNEEKVLISGLPGYGEYMKKVKYRLIPLIW